MKVEDIVLKVDEARHLQNLGLNMDDAALWFIRPDWKSEWMVSNNARYCKEFKYARTKNNRLSIPTYTLQEMERKIPLNIIINGNSYGLYSSPIGMCYFDERKGNTIFYQMGKNRMKNIYKMLCVLLQINKIL